MMPPLALADGMLDRVMAAAALLRADHRGNFLRSAAGPGSRHPGRLAEIEEAITFTFGCYGVMRGQRRHP
jgi:hypothetical protein